MQKRPSADRLRFAASLIHADLLHLGRTIEQLEAAGCDALHVQASDGFFAPGLTCGPGLVRAAKAASKLPCIVHLLTANPDAHVRAFVEAGADAVVVPVETTRHLHRTLTQIRDLGPACGVSVNPATPLTKLEYVLRMIDRLHVFVRDAGAPSKHYAGSSYDRVRILRENLSYLECRTALVVEGVHDARNAAVFANLGADEFILDDAVLFQGDDPGVELDAFRREVEAQRPVA